MKYHLVETFFGNLPHSKCFKEFTCTANKYPFEFNNGNTGKIYEICSK